jgi:DNA polymerase-3 subunit delta
MHATEYLKAPDQQEIGPVVALHGAERHLKRAVLDGLVKTVLGAGDEEFGLTRFVGKEVELKTVSDELRTVSMWGDRRLVVVEDADDFVTKNRAGLEKYVEQPSSKSVLILDVKSWPKTTRLAKRVTKVGLDLQCAELTGKQLARWLTETCRDKHGKQLSRDAAGLMVQLAGTDLGLLDQELAKLTAFVGERGRIETEDVRALVGGWKAETTWTMIGAVRTGDVGTALTCLDKLLVAGEAPQRILGGLGFVFRKLAKATELARQGIPLYAALRQAGVFSHEVADSTRYLRRLGYSKAQRLYGQLLKMDGNLKGGSRVAPRIAMEQLLVQLSGKL